MNFIEKYIHKLEGEPISESSWIDPAEFSAGDPHDPKRGRVARAGMRMEVEDDILDIKKEVQPVIRTREIFPDTPQSGEAGHLEDPHNEEPSNFNNQLNMFVRNLRKFGGVPAPVAIGTYDDGTEIPYWESGIRMHGEFVKPTEVLGYPKVDGLDVPLKTEYTSAGSPRVVTMFDDGLFLTITPGL